ncbi:hypothetical protein HMPREF1989_01533, partial [Porphyromonas gingivalis F0566]
NTHQSPCKGLEKVLKRVAYGFRDQQYFNLRLYALHHASVTLNVG